MNKPFIIGSEQNIAWRNNGFIPEKERLKIIWNFYHSFSSTNKYINAGTFIGYCDYILTVIKNLQLPPLKDDGMTDQYFFYKLYCSDKKAISIDENKQIFACQTSRTYLLNLDFKIENNQLVNRSNNTKPCILHLAGDADHGYYAFKNMSTQLGYPKTVDATDKSIFFPFKLVSQYLGAISFADTFKSSQFKEVLFLKHPFLVLYLFLRHWFKK